MVVLAIAVLGCAANSNVVAAAAVKSFFIVVLTSLGLGQISS
jgi:hypothetical protein